MCEFVSWIKDKKKIHFLTANQVFDTPRGKLLRDHIGERGCPADDYVGHGAIRFFYELDSGIGTQKECTNFSTPQNFPPQIVKAIKDGKFWRLGIPEGILTAPAREAYCKAKAQAFAELFADPNNRVEAWR